MIKHEGDIHCDVHGCIHEQTTNPYDGPPNEYKNGKPVWWADYDGTPLEPECQPYNWRLIWLGKYCGNIL